MSTNEEYEKIAKQWHRWRSSSRTRSRRQQHQAQRTRQQAEAGRRHRQRWSEIHSSRRRSRPSSRDAPGLGHRQDACVRHPDQESYTQKQLRRPQGTTGPTILTGGSKETQEQMRSSKRLVFTGGARDECEARQDGNAGGSGRTRRKYP